MQTIEDGMIKKQLLIHMQKVTFKVCGETSSTLVARRQQRMIIDANMELVQYMHPHTLLLLRLFKTCNTIELVKLITVVGI
jgi:hypothetical protein